MALFGDLFGLGDAAKQQAAQTQAFIQQQAAADAAQRAAAEQKGLGLLEAGKTGALGAIQPAIAQGRADIAGSVDPAISALYGGQALGAEALGAGQAGGLAALQSGVGQAMGAFDPLAAAAGRYGAAGGGASNMSADALGLNGPEGIARAQAAFQASPGYQFQLNQGIDALTRSANAATGGNPFGGNLLRESQQFGSGLANMEFQKWLANLAGREGLYAPLERGALGDVAGGRAQAALTGGTGAANIYTGTGGRLADLYAGTAGRAAPVYTGAGQNLAELSARGGLAEAGVHTGTAGLGAGLVGDLSKAGSTFGLGTLKPYGDAGAMAATGQMAGDAATLNFLSQLGGAGINFFKPT